MSEPSDPTPSPAAPVEQEASPDLLHLHREHEICGATTDGGFTGLVRRLLDRLLWPLWDRQTRYNAANARVASELCHGLDNLARRVAAFERDRERAHGEVMSYLAGAQAALRGELLAPIRDLERRLAASHDQDHDRRHREAEGLTRRLDLIAERQAAEIQTLGAALAGRLERLGGEIEAMLREQRASLAGPDQGPRPHSTAAIAERDASSAPSNPPPPAGRRRS